MVQKRIFPLRVVLTVTTELLLTKIKSDDDNGVGDFYDILNYMTQDNLWTHQLARAMRECKPWILRWYPELTLDKELTNLKETLKFCPTRQDEITCIENWLRFLVDTNLCKAEYELEPIPMDDHEHKDPYDEAVIIRGRTKIS